MKCSKSASKGPLAETPRRSNTRCRVRYCCIFTAVDLENRGNAAFTLRGVNVTGLPVAYPGAPVRGVQIGMIERF